MLAQTAPKGNEKGTNLFLPLSTALSPLRVQQCEAFVRCLRDDESIEFDYKINIEECAH